jgi:hypothetical protein
MSRYETIAVVLLFGSTPVIDGRERVEGVPLCFSLYAQGSASIIYYYPLLAAENAR